MRSPATIPSAFDRALSAEIAASELIRVRVLAAALAVLLVVDELLLIFARDLTGRTYPDSEAPTLGFHGGSHHGEDPRRINEYAKLNQYHLKMLAHLVENLSKTKEGDGTLLDRSLVLYGTNMGNSNQHLHYDVPHVLVGKLNGKMKGNRHLAYPTKQVPTGNLLLSILDKFDIHQESIGDSTGRLENL